HAHRLLRRPFHVLFFFILRRDFYRISHVTFLPKNFAFSALLRPARAPGKAWPRYSDTAPGSDCHWRWPPLPAPVLLPGFRKCRLRSGLALLSTAPPPARSAAWPPALVHRKSSRPATRC